MLLNAKHTMKLIVFLSIATLLLLSCTPKGTATPQIEDTQAVATQAPEISTETQEAPTEEVVEDITLVVWDFGGVSFEWMESMAIPAFQEEHPNIKIEHLGVPESDYAVKLDTAIAAGEVPDIAYQSYTYKLWKAGHVLPLNDFLARDGFSIDDFYPIFTSWNMIDDIVYAMPGPVFTWGMIYNKDLFTAAGLPELTTETVITYEDWLEYARAINVPAEDLEDRIWGATDFPPPWNSMNNYMSDPFVLGDDGKTCVGSADSEDWINAWTALLTAHEEGLTTDSSTALLGDLGASDVFKQGKLGMMYGTYGNALDIQKAGINVGYTGQPVITPGWEGNVGSWMSSYAIMSGTEYPEQAWEFLKFLTTEVAEMRAYGDCASCGDPPSYKPIAVEWAGDDSLRLDTLKLLDRVVSPPFNPDIWTSVDPFYEAWRRMTEDGVDVATAVQEASLECQQITDDLWEEWEFLGE
jgi:ABC-type glycerol-3-phosphate transport system substrate-binding protein